MAQVRFDRCSVVAVFHPGNDSLSPVGVRLNDPASLSIGFFITPIPSQSCSTTGTTGGVGLPSPPPPQIVCVNQPPIAGSYALTAVRTTVVATVKRLHVIRQPPPPEGSTTG
jgi:hypothetical protein